MTLSDILINLAVLSVAGGAALLLRDNWPLAGVGYFGFWLILDVIALNSGMLSPSQGAKVRSNAVTDGIFTAVFLGVWLWRRRGGRKWVERLWAKVREHVNGHRLEIVPVQDRGDTPPRTLAIIAGVVFAVAALTWVVGRVVG